MKILFNLTLAYFGFQVQQEVESIKTANQYRADDEDIVTKTPPVLSSSIWIFSFAYPLDYTVERKIGECWNTSWRGGRTNHCIG